MTRRFDHLDLRVRDLEAVRAFYEALLPALGFTRNDSDAVWIQYMAEGDGPTEFVGVTADPAHRPTATRVAFRAERPAEVDALAALVRRLGALNVEGPAYEAPHYYAVFFEDPDGNRLEVCHRTRN